MRHVEQAFAVVVARAGQRAARFVGDAGAEDVVLQVLADSRQIDDHRNAERAQAIGRAVPDSCNSLGESTAPAQSITSRSTRTCCVRSPCLRMTPLQRPRSIVSRNACAAVSTVRFARRATGSRYAAAALSRRASWMLSWFHAAPVLRSPPMSLLNAKPSALVAAMNAAATGWRCGACCSASTCNGPLPP